jgi:uncharacterized repeat protein (TIGR01451 family)/LPXTG-motif cell wall-anchored protein
MTVPARPNDIIEYHLITRNSGAGTVNNFVIQDDLSNVLDNTTFLSASNGGSLSGNTVVYPQVSIAAGQTIERTFKVKVNNQAENSDFRMRNIYGNEVIIIIERPHIVQNPVLGIEKLVRNVTKGENAFVKENSANPKDILEYRLVIKNTGDAVAKNVTLRDVLPVPVSYVEGSLQILLPNGTVITEPTLFNQNISVGNLRPFATTGDKINVIFRVKVSKEIASGSRIENKAVTQADDGLIARSFAYTNVVSEPVVTPTPSPTTPTPHIKGISTLTPTGVSTTTLLAIAGLILIIIGSIVIIRNKENN